MAFQNQGGSALREFLRGAYKQGRYFIILHRTGGEVVRFVILRYPNTFATGESFKCPQITRAED